MKKRVPVLKDGKVLRDEDGNVLEFNAVNQEELDRKIDAPQVAQVGEVLTVEEVDEDGKPVKWKTAPGVDITTELSEESTDKQVPSAKAAYNAIQNTTDKDAVRFVEQELTDAQKQQARENIGTNPKVFYAPGETIAVPTYGNGVFTFSKVLLSLPIPRESGINSFELVRRDGSECCSLYFYKTTSEDGTVQITIHSQIVNYKPVITECVQYFGDLYVVSFTLQVSNSDNAPAKLVASRSGMTLAPSLLTVATAENAGAVKVNTTDYDTDTEKPVRLTLSNGACVSNDVAFTTASKMYKTVLGKKYSIIIVRDDIAEFVNAGFAAPYHMIFLSQETSGSRALLSTFAVTSSDGSKFTVTCDTDAWGSSPDAGWTINEVALSTTALLKAGAFIFGLCDEDYDTTNVTYGNKVLNKLLSGKSCWYYDGICHAVTGWTTINNCGSGTLTVYYSTTVEFQVSEGNYEDILAIRALSFAI